MKIGQLSFVQLTEPASAPYGSAGFGSKYQGQKGPDADPPTGRTSSDVLVTGATGFVGPRIVHALRARELPVRALVRDRRKGRTLETWGCELAVGDVTDAGEPARPRSRAATCVVHLVAIRQGKPEQFQRVMVDGTRNVLAAARGGRGAAVRPHERARHGRGRRRISSRTTARSGRWSRTCRRPAWIRT